MKSVNSLDEQISTELLHQRAVNALRGNGCCTVRAVLDLSDYEIAGIRNIGKTTVNEIMAFIEENIWMKALELAPEELAVSDMIRIPEYRNRVETYVKNNDVPLRKYTFSVRTENCLSRAKLENISDIILYGKQDFSNIPNMGIASMNEVKEKIDEYLLQNGAEMKAYCLGDDAALMTDDNVKKRIFSLISEKEFEGAVYEEIEAKLPALGENAAHRLKQLIGEMIDEGQLEYVDFHLYRSYVKVDEWLEKSNCLKEEEYDIFAKRIHGKSLDEVKDDYGISRERIRQKQDKALKKLRDELYAETGTTLFHEDYYRYLFLNYKVDKELCKDWIKLDDMEYNYLRLAYARATPEGEKHEIAMALKDSSISMVIKMQIVNYQNRKNLLIDGHWIKGTRENLENYVISMLGGETMTYDEFIEKYNDYLLQRGIEGEDYLITEASRATRENKLMTSKQILWTQGKHIRYYDISQYDFTELLQAISIERYKNIQISTLKWFNDFPDVMQKYDIRDHYELHNVLKKIIDMEAYPNLGMKKMPMVIFDEGTVKDSIYELLETHSPIKYADFINLIYTELGYDKDTIMGSYTRDFQIYYHGGMYSLDYKVMSSENMRLLQNSLTEDFYYLEEVKEIYRELVPNGNMEEVNAYNLKTMGFNVYSDYILQNHTSADAYFNALLTQGDIIDMQNIKRRYAYNQTYYGVLRKLRTELEVFWMDDNTVITFKRLQDRMGITKEDIKGFCDDVNKYVEDDSYFTIKSLLDRGFTHKLCDLGFDELFYASILAVDERFAVISMYGTSLVHKGGNNITIKSFLEDYIARERQIDILDLMTDLKNTYGCKVEIISDILTKLGDSDVYYDDCLQRLYASVELFYKEIEGEV